jgi:hypothetical protein
VKTFILVILIINLLSVISRFILLRIAKYPRKRTITIREEVMGLSLDVAIAAWATIILW